MQGAAASDKSLRRSQSKLDRHGHCKRGGALPAAVAGFLYAASLWLSNASYLYLSVSFIQMTKSLMPGLVYASVRRCLSLDA